MCNLEKILKTTCGIVLINKYNQILGSHPTRHKVNQWDIIKGVPDPGEDYIAAIYREFREETGIVLSNICSNVVDYSTIADVEYEYAHGKKKLHGFVGLVDNDSYDISEFKCNSMVTGFNGLPEFPEIDAFAWVDIYDVEFFHMTQQRFIRELFYTGKFFKKGATFKPQPKDHLYG